MTRIEIDGHQATTETLAHPATSTTGNFTAMQVRNGKVRGLDLHLARLRAATSEIFAQDLDDTLVRTHIRHALNDITNASLRVYVFQPHDALSIMITTTDPAEPKQTPQRLRTVPYTRPFPHLKHLGGFAQTHYTKLAQNEGYDDALLVTPDGLITEGTTTNIGFFEEETAIWPDAPVLLGITMQLINSALTTPPRLAEIHIEDLPRFDSAFLTNSRGIVPVSSIDNIDFPVDPTHLKQLADAYDSVPWEKP
ncbi:aminotransferase class IV [Umezawaea endophytica]|uniref:Aminotransferase class IV n=1 Tax=Umezawaea endophytica TaxID=1654476 RepID=A0A9X2VWN4_9PSEU|nr:aminotransferase class IV [Umezawaea endophytica]MCS7483971.1 aminotransferase class IV [Umezawaea endophytica]